MPSPYPLHPVTPLHSTEQWWWCHSKGHQIPKLLKVSKGGSVKANLVNSILPRRNKDFTQPIHELVKLQTTTSHWNRIERIGQDKMVYYGLLYATMNHDKPWNHSPPCQCRVLPKWFRRQQTWPYPYWTEWRYCNQHVRRNWSMMIDDLFESTIAGITWTAHSMCQRMSLVSSQEAKRPLFSSLFLNSRHSKRNQEVASCAHCWMAPTQLRKIYSEQPLQRVNTRNRTGLQQAKRIFPASCQCRIGPNWVGHQSCLALCWNPAKCSVTMENSQEPKSKTVLSPQSQLQPKQEFDYESVKHLNKFL